MNRIIHAGPDYADETPVTGFYIFDGIAYHGPYSTIDAAVTASNDIEDDARQERYWETRHLRSLRPGAV